jgi:hypothetical protein
MKPLLIFLLITSLNAYADEYVTGGGYDYKAVEADEKAKADTAAKQKAAQIKARKLKQQAIAKKKKEEELLPANIVKFTDHNACIKTGKAAGTPEFQIWIQELKRRDLAFHIDAIQKHEININGSECDIYATFGLPKKLNRTVNAQGVRKQFVYDHGYIYTDNGLITSWQD